MSHAHTVIEPAVGLTVLVGANNCGKSAVMTALQILCHNEPSTYVTRHGEKECSVTVEMETGDRVQWVRNKTSTKYVINGETFDRLRGNIPTALQDVLRMSKVKLDQSPDDFDIHFGSQKKPVFLINDSGRAAAGFFAASSDASRLIEMQKLHSQKVKDTNRELKRVESEAEKLTADIEKLDPIPELHKSFESCNQLTKAIEIHENAAASLIKRIRKLASVEIQHIRIAQRIKIVGGLKDPPALHDTNHLSGFLLEIEKTAKRIESLTAIQQCVSKLSPPVEQKPTSPLNKLVAQIDTERKELAAAKIEEALLRSLNPPPTEVSTEPLRQLLERVAENRHQIRQHRDRLKQLEHSVNELDAELADFVVANPTCPMCKQTLTPDHLKNSVLRGSRAQED